MITQDRSIIIHLEYNTKHILQYKLFKIKYCTNHLLYCRMAIDFLYYFPNIKQYRHLDN